MSTDRFEPTDGMPEEGDFVVMGIVDDLIDELRLADGDPMVLEERQSEAIAAGVLAYRALGEKLSQDEIRTQLLPTLRAIMTGEAVSPVEAEANTMMQQVKSMAGIDAARIRAALIESGNRAVERLPDGASAERIRQRARQAMVRTLGDILTSLDEEGAEEAPEIMRLDDVDEDEISDRSSGGGKRRRKRLDDEEND